MCGDMARDLGPEGEQMAGPSQDREPGRRIGFEREMRSPFWAQVSVGGLWENFRGPGLLGPEEERGLVGPRTMVQFLASAPGGG